MSGVLHGLKLELEDSNYDLLDEIIITANLDIATKDVNIAILLGGYPRLPGMERKDLISINAKGIKEQASSLNNYANSNCKVVVIANPANTNCLVAIHNAPNIPKNNFTCLTRLDQGKNM